MQWFKNIIPEIDGWPSNVQLSFNILHKVHMKVCDPISLNKKEDNLFSGIIAL